MSTVSRRTADQTDARLLRELSADPRATTLALAQRLGMSRNTIQARLARLDRQGFLLGFDRRIDPAALGYPIGAVMKVVVRQRSLDALGAALAEIPEVIEVLGVSGATDLLVRIAGTDADDLYRTAGRVLALDGVERTDTALIMRPLVAYRVEPLLDRLLES